MKIVTIDVETVSNPLSERADAALIPPLATVVSCAIHSPTKRGEVIVRTKPGSFSLVARPDEYDIVLREGSAFDNILKGRLDEISKDNCTLVTFNGRSYDIPVIVHGLASKGIQVPPLLKHAFLHQKRWEFKPHCDLREAMSGSGLYREGTLHDYCVAYEIDSPKRNGVDGSSVEELYRDGKYQEIADYNWGDTVATYRLYCAWRKAWE